MPRLRAGWRDAVTLHRLEWPFGVNYLCYASWGACFAATDAGELVGLGVLAAIMANLLLIVAALALNSAADVATDEVHADRSHLASAALRVGRGRLMRWAAAEMAVALVLAGAVAAWSGRPLVAAAAVAIVVLQVSYNVEPIRLKRRGLTGVAAFCAAVLVLPFLLAYWTVRPDLDAPAGLIVTGLGSLAIGRMTLWSVPDRTADARTGMRTPSVRYGSAGALALAAAMIIAGLFLTGWGLWWRYGPGWALPLVAVQATFLYGTASRNRVSSVRIRRRVMTPVMIGTVALTITPFLAA